MGLAPIIVNEWYHTSLTAYNTKVLPVCEAIKLIYDGHVLKALLTIKSLYAPPVVLQYRNTIIIKALAQPRTTFPVNKNKTLLHYSRIVTMHSMMDCQSKQCNGGNKFIIKPACLPT